MCFRQLNIIPLRKEICIRSPFFGILSCLVDIGQLHRYWVDHQNWSQMNPIHWSRNQSSILTKVEAIETKCVTLTLKSEFIPQTRSFSRRVGAQPKPSMEFCRSNDRHTSPSSDIFGCHSFVVHFTLGGWKRECSINLALWLRLIQKRISSTMKIRYHWKKEHFFKNWEIKNCSLIYYYKYWTILQPHNNDKQCRIMLRYKLNYLHSTVRNTNLQSYCIPLELIS